MTKSALLQSLCLVTLNLSTFAHLALASSATWNLNPTSSDWNTANNWTPATVPNGAQDVATFAASNLTSVSVSDNTEVDSAVFNPGASAFTITVAPASSFAQFTASGAGVINNSGLTQNFIVGTSVSTHSYLQFQGNATAGTLTSYTLEWTKGAANFLTFLKFAESSSAGDAIITGEGGSAPDHGGGNTQFYDQSTAAHATIILNGGTVPNAHGSLLTFSGSATAGEATLTVNGSVGGARATGAFIIFGGNSSAGHATIVVNGTAPGVAAGAVFFNGGSSAETARIELFGTGLLDITGLTRGVEPVGSIEGDGLVNLFKYTLSIGSNDLSTTFSGTITDRGKGGSVIKVGAGTLTLSGVNTYAGGTTMNEGFLKLTNTKGSATGSGALQVNGGTVGGSGIIGGSVTIGSGTGTGAFLAPGIGMTTLTIQGSLSFKADGSYTPRLNTRRATADQVMANGVTIETGAQFSLLPKGTQEVPLGTVFTAINNTAATATTGTFANLPDGGTITVGSNTFQANYEGGDGNDLTLTVVP